MLEVLAWRQAVIARGATYRFFEHLRTISPPTSYSRTGIICSAQSPPPPYDHPDAAPNGPALPQLAHSDP
jgi:hypothetical protein